MKDSRTKQECPSKVRTVDTYVTLHTLNGVGLVFIVMQIHTCHDPLPVHVGKYSMIAIEGISLASYPPASPSTNTCSFDLGTCMIAYPNC